MSKTPKIAVLLAAYNGQNWIRRQIDSILEQKDVDLSIYINIDLSTDLTFQICDDLQRAHQNIHIHRHDEVYGGAALNFFTLASQVNFNEFEYVAFSDQDDIWLVDKLSQAISVLTKTKSDGYSSNALAFWESGKTKLIRKSQPQVQFDYLFEAAGPGCTYVLSRRLADHVQRFLLDNLESVQTIALHDWLFYAFARSNGYHWHIDSNAFIRYRQHESNQMGSNTGLHAVIKRVSMVRSHWYRNQVLLITKLVRTSRNSQFIDQAFPGDKVINTFLILNNAKLRRRLLDRVALFVMLVLRVF